MHVLNKLRGGYHDKKTKKWIKIRTSVENQKNASIDV